MKSRMMKRILTLMMACALALCQVCLAQSIEVVTAVDNAKVYDAQGTVMGTLPANTALTLTGVKGSVCRVERDGNVAYMLKSDLKQAAVETITTEAEPQAQNEMSATAYVARDGAVVYSAEGKAAGTLSRNTQVTVTAVKGNACRVALNGKTGYMKKGDLSAQKVNEESAQTAQTADVKGFTGYVNKDGAQMVDRSGSVIAALNLNAEVRVTATKGNVCQVSVNGKTGYMLKGDLSADKKHEVQQDEPVQVQATPGYVAVDKAKVYDKKGNEIATLKQNAAVTVTAYNDNLVQVATGSTKGYMKKSDISDSPVANNNKNYTDGANKSNGPVGGSTVAPATGTAKEMDWWSSDIQKIFSRGTVCQVTDVETGISWREKRFGGMNHADCQPLTAADTAALKNAYGGVWSWDRHAVFVTIDGVNYAASINGMPHGGQSIKDNNFEGHHCIHFTNSRCHFNDKVDSAHQKAIKKAAAATLQ